VVADSTIEGRQGEPARGRAGHDGVEAPATAVDLDDVPRLDSL